MKSFPFTSDGGDRKVYTKDFRQLFSKYFTNGVFDGGFAVTPATGMKVNISSGWCNINGVFGYSEETVEKQIETVSSETYFNIVLRLDDNKATRNIEIYVVKGTSSPAELTRNETVYELCIARIKVGVNNQSITLSMIEDTRLNTDLCGIVANAVQTLNTDTYYNQFQGALDEFLDTVDQALDGTLAGNLQNQINNYWETVYRVGDIYTTTLDEDDPNERFGGEWELIPNTPQTLSVIDTKVVSFSSNTDGVKIHSFSDIQTMFFEEYGVKPSQKEQIGISFTNGDSSANQTHIEGGTWLNNDLFVVLNSSTANPIRVNYHYCFVHTDNTIKKWKRVA